MRKQYRRPRVKDGNPAFKCGGEFHMQGLDIDDAVVSPTTIALPDFRGVVLHATTRLRSAVNLSTIVDMQGEISIRGPAWRTHEDIGTYSQ